MSDRFDVEETPLPGVHVFERLPRSDERGWLERMYDRTELERIVGPRTIVQINRTSTRARGTVRGMHYQVPPSAETKIVACLQGSIFDVAVDVRRGSPTFLRWHAVELTRANRRSLVVPEGLAHGFQALDDDCEVLYLTTSAYDPDNERGLYPLDPVLGIEWPLAVANLSPRDAAHPLLGPDFDGIPL
jgi:dTDP-4-dehydrorhamnose 3,5-epimerase